MIEQVATIWYWEQVIGVSIMSLLLIALAVYGIAYLFSKIKRMKRKFRNMR